MCQGKTVGERQRKEGEMGRRECVREGVCERKRVGERQREER